MKTTLNKLLMRAFLWSFISHYRTNKLDGWLCISIYRYECDNYWKSILFYTCIKQLKQHIQDSLPPGRHILDRNILHNRMRLFRIHFLFFIYRQYLH